MSLRICQGCEPVQSRSSNTNSFVGADMEIYSFQGCIFSQQSKDQCHHARNHSCWKFRHWPLSATLTSPKTLCALPTKGVSAWTHLSTVTRTSMLHMFTPLAVDHEETLLGTTGVACTSASYCTLLAFTCECRRSQPRSLIAVKAPLLRKTSCTVLKLITGNRNEKGCPVWFWVVDKPGKTNHRDYKYGYGGLENINYFHKDGWKKSWKRSTIWLFSTVYPNIRLKYFNCVHTAVNVYIDAWFHETCLFILCHSCTGGLQ